MKSEQKFVMGLTAFLLTAGVGVLDKSLLIGGLCLFFGFMGLAITIHDFRTHRYSEPTVSEPMPE
jgi:hypothetical protein